jgi:hypothetical protein
MPNENDTDDGLFDFFRHQFEEFTNRDKGLNDFTENDDKLKEAGFTPEDMREEWGEDYGFIMERLDPDRPDTNANNYSEGEAAPEFVVEFNDADDLVNYLAGTPESVLRVYVGIDDEGEEYFEVYRYDS